MWTLFFVAAFQCHPCLLADGVQLFERSARPALGTEEFDSFLLSLRNYLFFRQVNMDYEAAERAGFACAVYYGLTKPEWSTEQVLADMSRAHPSEGHNKTEGWLEFLLQFMRPLLKNILTGNDG